MFLNRAWVVGRGVFHQLRDDSRLLGVVGGVFVAERVAIHP